MGEVRPRVVDGQRDGLFQLTERVVDSLRGCCCAVNFLRSTDPSLEHSFGLRDGESEWQHRRPRLPHGVTVAQQILTLLV